jgi:hypothetical protein
MIVTNFKKKQKRDKFTIFTFKIQKLFLCRLISNFLDKFLEKFTAVFYTVQNALIGHFEAPMTYCNVGNHGANPHFPSIPLGWMIEEGMGSLAQQWSILCNIFRSCNQ